MYREPGRRFSWVLLLTLVAGLVCVPVSPRAEAPVGEDEIKAAFLQRFLMFISWPEEAIAASDSLVIGVVGDGSTSEAIAKLDGSDVRNQHVVILRDMDPDAMAARCQVIFIPEIIGHLARTDHPRWKNLTWLKERPVLTVGEDEDFIAAGGAINFFLQDQRVRFAISSGAVDRAGLTVRSTLMRLAEVVD